MHPVSEAVRVRHLTSLSSCIFPGKLPDFIEFMSFSGKVLIIQVDTLLLHSILIENMFKTHCS